MLLTKENFLKEAEKFILNYNNTFNNDYKKLDVDSGILERFIFDHQEDEDVRKFLVRAIKQGLSLIDTLVDFIHKENNFKNDKTLSFLILYIYQIEPYYSQLRSLVDYTGYHGGFKDLRIMLDLLNKCSLLSWDGFHGKHPKGVKDGIMFSLQAVLNGGKTIKAEGSENFPRHYRDFTDGLYSLLNDDRQ